MIRFEFKLLIFYLSFLFFSCSSIQKQPIDEVDPFIGVDGGGNVLPGPCLPFGLVRLNPVVDLPHPTNGYESGRPIAGFIQTNVSGTGGGGRYGNFMVTPQLNKVDLENISSTISNETSNVGYYSGVLDKNNIKVELTATEKVGVQRFTFPQGEVPYILFTASSVIDLDRDYEFDAKCINSDVNINEDESFSGSIEIKGGWGHMQPYKLYLYAAFDTPVKEYGVWKDLELYGNKNTTNGEKCGAYFSFDNSSESITLKIGVSTLSVEKAKQSITEYREKTFEEIHSHAQDVWSKYLNKIKVSGGTDEQLKLFYTSLYRSFVMPTDITGENPLWETNEPSYWDFYCIWDTFRSNFPLYSIIAPDKNVEMIRALLDVYKHTGWLPDAWIVGGIGKQQGGTDADNIISDAVAKGLEGFDYELALNAMVNNSERYADENDTYESLIHIGKHREYIENGYVPMDKLCCVSYTLEYAYNDFCLSRVAAALGKNGIADKYLQRSLNCYNLFNAETKFFWAKDKSGNWAPDFSPTHQGNPWWKGPYFYEGTPFHYSTYVLHDVNGLIARHGGKKKFASFLDEFFNGNFFTHENEPDIHSPYLYNYVGKPYKTASIIYDILNKQYHAKRDGWPGNDDSGALSSWYVFSSIGFYPMAGQDFYLIGTPTFKQTDIALPNGEKFVVRAINLSAGNIYIKSVTLNGENYDKSWIKHSDIAKGGELCFEMSNKPTDWATNCIMPKSASQIINK